ncbi:hypothetical protein F5884DRAFT_229606 [Xylogone sp. PMI_703]|nr:hypothetical protein F5884DRAFT_229606 [Xylogone sp. PMI_703]
MIMRTSSLLTLIVTALLGWKTAFVSAAEDIEYVSSVKVGGMFRRDGVSGANLQTFTGALGGAVAPPITESSDSSRPFEVDGDTFPDFSTAAQRSCNNQHNSCAKIANSNKSAGFTAGDCDSQQDQCVSSISSATQTAFPVLKSSNAEFDFFCDS